jgi:hypothetical protein
MPLESRHLDSNGTRPHAFSVANMASCTGRGVTDRLLAICWLEPLSCPAAEGEAGAFGIRMPEFQMHVFPLSVESTLRSKATAEDGSVCRPWATRARNDLGVLPSTGLGRRRRLCGNLDS